MELQDPALLHHDAFIDGTWTGSVSGKHFPVVNPANGEELGRVPDMVPEDADRAIKAAERAFLTWRELSAAERSARLRHWYELILAHTEDLARIMTAEQGKPLAEARSEVRYAAAFVEWFAEEGKRLLGQIIPGPSPDKRVITLRQPVGVVAAITPWNFPMAMITRKVAPALAVGCTVVVKPAEDTPLSALALADLAQRAGFPAGTINILTTNQPAPMGRRLTASTTVRKLSFTGSTEVGKLLMRDSSDTVKRISLELGGNAPFLVFDDANIDAAVEGALLAKYRNTGQTCICANRIFVQDQVYETFVQRYSQAVHKLRVGHGMDQDVTIGPLINETALLKVERLVSEALSQGARVISGGERHALGGTFYQPTVLADVTPEMSCYREEIFGPVAPLIRFRTEAEGLRLANDTRYGLAAYFYARELGRIWRVAEGLEYGMVGINTGLISNVAAPFGGVKESGLGREGSHHGLEEFVEIKYLCLGGLSEDR